MVENITEIGLRLSDLLPESAVHELNRLIFISKIAVYIILAYVIFLLIKQFYFWKRNKRVNDIYRKVLEIDNKLDALISGHKNVDYEPEKKRGFFSRLFGIKDKLKKDKITKKKDSKKKSNKKK